VLSLLKSLPSGPPTENCSLTFRLSRNCGWNRCLFCPAYKLGAQFSRRGFDEVKGEIRATSKRAKKTSQKALGSDENESPEHVCLLSSPEGFNRGQDEEMA